MVTTRDICVRNNIRIDTLTTSRNLLFKTADDQSGQGIERRLDYRKVLIQMNIQSRTGHSGYQTQPFGNGCATVSLEMVHDFRSSLKSLFQATKYGSVEVRRVLY